MKTSEMLVAAKLHLWVPKDEAGTLEREGAITICEALAVAVGEKPSKPVRAHIMECLADKSAVTVSGWLAAGGFTSSTYFFACTPAERVQIQQFRLRWLEHLEAEYKAKGD